MRDPDIGPEVLAIKDESNERPIPTAWRPVLRSIVSAFVKGDYGLSAEVPKVEPISPETQAHIQSYVEGYGATLVELPEETWESSVCIWTGSHWDAMIDLWTQEEGRSDLVLSARVTEARPEFRFKIHMVYVP
jgi:hypothetical protein